MSHIERKRDMEEKGLKEELALADIQAPWKKKGKGEKKGMGRQWAWWCSSAVGLQQLGPNPREDP